VSLFGKLMAFLTFMISLAGLGVTLLYVVDQRQFAYEVEKRKHAIKLREFERSKLEAILQAEVIAREQGTRQMDLNGQNVTVAAARQEVRDQELGNPMRNLPSLADLGKQVDQRRLALSAKLDELQQARLVNEKLAEQHKEMTTQVAALQPPADKPGLIKEMQDDELAAKAKMEALRYPLFFERMKIAIVEKRNEELEARKKELVQKGLISLAP